MISISSADIRKKGADEYAIAFVQPSSQEHQALTGKMVFNKLHISMKIEHAKEALRLFCSASDAAKKEENITDLAYALKNFGYTSFRLASLVEFQTRNEMDTIVFYFKDSVKYLLDAILNGKKGKLPFTWIEKTNEMVTHSIHAFVQYLISKSTSWKLRCGKLGKLLEPAKPSLCVTSEIYFEIANEMMKAVVLLTEGEDWNAANSCLKDFEQALIFAQQTLHGVKPALRPPLLEQGLTDLEHSLRAYTCRIESSLSLRKGLDLLESLEADDEDQSMDMDMAFMVLDHFTEAIVLSKSTVTRYACLETEARASSYLGQFHYNQLKNEDRGNQYLMNVMQLCDSLTHSGGGNAFFQQDWYQNAKKLLEKIREKKVLYDQEKLEKERAPTLLKIKPLLDAMEEVMKDVKGKTDRCYLFLKHIYSKHPPKNGKTLKDDLDKNSDKDVNKACMQAVTDYHTDKKFNKEHGIEWYVLTEEIVKKLNDFRSYFKGFL